MSVQIFVCGGDRYRVDVSDARGYDPSARYELADTIKHPRFGYGLVVDVLETGVDVQFEDSRRRLVHGRRGEGR